MRRLPLSIVLTPVDTPDSLRDATDDVTRLLHLTEDYLSKKTRQKAWDALEAARQFVNHLETKAVHSETKYVSVRTASHVHREMAGIWQSINDALRLRQLELIRKRVQPPKAN